MWYTKGIISDVNYAVNYVTGYKNTNNNSLVKFYSISLFYV